MTQEMAMFWFGLSALIALWTLSQYRPHYHKPIRMPTIVIGMIDGLISKQTTENVQK